MVIRMEQNKLRWEVPIIIPSYEPDEKLPGLLRNLRDTGFQNIILVNDGSGEAYAHFFEEAKEVYGCVVLHHAVNQGKGRALKTAFNYCLREFCALPGVITADSDGQHSPECILACADELIAHPDCLILGCRCFEGKDVPARSEFGNKCTRIVMRYLTGITVSDTQTGLRGIPVSFMEELLMVKGERFEFETNMLLETKSRHIPILEVPIQTIYIEENKTSHFNPIKDSLKIYMIFGKFLFSSLSSSVVDLVLFSMLCFLMRDMRRGGITYITAATVFARILSALYNYLLNLKMVFQSDSPVKNTLPRYILLAVIQMSLSAFLVGRLYPLFGGAEVLVKIPVDILLFFLSFVIQREFVYANKRWQALMAGLFVYFEYLKIKKKRGKKMTKTIENFLQYAVIDTQSDETSGQAPSTEGQHNLAKLLTEQLSQMGADEITYDKEHCYVYASVPTSAGCENAPVLGFIAHMDTSPAVTGAGVKPRIVEQYDGEDILLNEDKNIVLRTADFPEIKRLKGQDLIVTDGTTLLGADDKAGVAEIMAMAEHLLTHPEVKHGKIRLGFTPDEEIGEGTDHFNVELFGADFAFTVDGGELGELEHETFNAAGARLIVHGRSVHPGSAKGKMINSILVAQEFQSLLPVFQNPMYTEGYEGFFHLDGISGNVEETTAEYIIRDHDRALFEEKKELFLKCVQFLNLKYGEGTLEAVITDSYYNMKEVLVPYGHLMENAAAALKELGAEPKVNPIRGGTDGARLSYMGLPCPNLCTGGANYHSRFEYACVQSMEKVTELLIKLAVRYGEISR